MSIIDGGNFKKDWMSFCFNCDSCKTSQCILYFNLFYNYKSFLSYSKSFVPGIDFFNEIYGWDVIIAPLSFFCKFIPKGLSVKTWYYKKCVRVKLAISIKIL